MNMQGMRGTVYFLRQEGSDRIKIGWTSRDVERRLAELQTGNPQRLVLVGSIVGTQADEQRLHLHFARHREAKGGTEWFRPCDELLALIATGAVGEMVGTLPKPVQATFEVQAAPVLSVVAVHGKKPSSTTMNERPIVRVVTIKKK